MSNVTTTATEPLWFIANKARVHVECEAFDLVEVEGRQGDMPPLHVHHEHDETFVVLEGRLSLHLPGSSVELGPGESFFAPRGIPHVYRVESDAPVAALVNPVLEWAGKETEPLDEGCLSLPGVLVEVERPIHVRVRGRDEYGEEILIEASGLEARVIQHEMDHLDGVLILDRTSRDQRKRAMRTLREADEAASAA